jgi:hypothetical protein
MAHYLAHSRKQEIIKIAIMQKEVEIIKRDNQKKRLRTKYSDRVIISILNVIEFFRSYKDKREFQN